MAHVYYHGVGNSGGSSGGSGNDGGGAILCIGVVIAIALLFVAPLFVGSFLLMCLFMMFVSESHHEEKIFKYWPLSFLFIWIYNVYNDCLHPIELHGWLKIGYYLGILLLSIGSTYGVDWLLKKIITKESVIKTIEWIPLVLTYVINFTWTNNFVMSVIKGIWHFIEWIGKTVG